MTQTLDMQKYREKLKLLVEMAKKKKNVLEHSEIAEVYQDMNLTAEQMESVYEYLENQNSSNPTFHYILDNYISVEN